MEILSHQGDQPVVPTGPPRPDELTDKETDIGKVAQKTFSTQPASVGDQRQLTGAVDLTDNLEALPGFNHLADLQAESLSFTQLPSYPKPQDTRPNSSPNTQPVVEESLLKSSQQKSTLTEHPHPSAHTVEENQVALSRSEKETVQTLTEAQKEEAGTGLIQPSEAPIAKPALDKGKERIEEEPEEAQFTKFRDDVRLGVQSRQSNEEIVDYLTNDAKQMGATSEDIWNVVLNIPKAREAFNSNPTKILEAYNCQVKPGQTPEEALKEDAQLRKVEREKHESELMEARRAQRIAESAAESNRRALLTLDKERQEATNETNREIARSTTQGQTPLVQELLKDELVRDGLEVLQVSLKKQEEIHDTRLWDLQQRMAHRTSWPFSRVPPIFKQSAPLTQQSVSSN